MGLTLSMKASKVSSDVLYNVVTPRNMVENHVVNAELLFGT